MSRFYFFIILLFEFNLALGQGISGVDEPEQRQETDFIKVLSNAHKDSVVLRWAPSSPVSWKLLNQYGYRVERYTIIRDGAVLEEKPMAVLSEVLKPAPQSQWEFWMDRDDMVAVAAQAIFGEEFQIDADQADIMQIYQKVRELESRYSFGLFAADLSAKAAQLSALGITDRNVRENEMYLYRVHSLVPAANAEIQFGFAYTGPSEAAPLPTPAPPEIETVSESSVLIRWETNALRDVYIGYYLECSEDDGKTFKKVNRVPMTIMESALNGDGTAYSAQSDTMVVNRKVMYRITGLNSFGETGPPSDLLVFTGELKFDFNPAIVKTEVIENSRVKLSWEFPAEGLTELKGYEIEHSDKAHEGYAVISHGLIDGGQSEFIDQSPSSTNYYRVVAVSAKGLRSQSFPHLVQLEDSIPPLPPAGLTAGIDSTGVVQLSWKNNKERDLLGYRVYRSSFKNSEFSQITVSPVEDSIYVDTINIKTLTTRIFYKIVAVDNRFNPSAYSEPVQLKLPDVIPPVPPVIRGVRSSKGGVELRWVNSSSKDVAEHRILRKHQFTVSWSAIASIKASDTARVFFDEIDSRHRYQYALIAVDSAGLKSTMTSPVWGSALPSDKSRIENIQGLADRENKIIRLSWSYGQSDVVKFLVYRATRDTNLSLYKSVASADQSFVDRNLAMDTEYIYRVKAVFRDGTESYFSDEVKVNF